MLVVIGELFIAASTYSDAWFWHTWGVSVSKFTVLSAESLNPEHPLHDEFTARMDDIWENYSQYPWLVPPQLGSWKSSMRPVVRKAMEIMDGVQLWWLRKPEVDLCKEWARMENMLFPSPLWDAYR
jgi:hypothetical protein